MTKEEKLLEINSLKAKNNTALGTWMAVGLLGSIGGVVVAHKMGYKFWGKVGFFILGGMVVGVPLRLIYNTKIQERKGKIAVLTQEVKDTETQELMNKADQNRQNQVKSQPLTEEQKKQAQDFMKKNELLLKGLTKR